MAVTLETIHRDMQKIKNELVFLRHVMEEDYELSKDAEKKLEAARKASNGEHIAHEDIMTKYG